MTGRQFGIVRRWWWLVFAGAALGAGAALIAVRATSPVYRATSTLLVISPSDASLNESLARTYARMAVHPRVLQRIGELLETSADRLDGMISARPVPDTQLVEIVGQAGEATLARDIANMGAQAFIEQQGAQLPAGLAGPSVRLGQLAVTPDQPIGLRPPPPAVALGMLLGSLLALGLAGLLEAPGVMPALLAMILARRPGLTAVRRRGLAPAIGERIGPLDVARGGVVTAVVFGVLLISVALAGAQRSAPGRAAPEQSAAATAPSVALARSAAPQIAEPPPAQPDKAPTVPDVPLDPIAVLGSGPTAAGGEAEIAGATSVAPPEPVAAIPAEAPATGPPAASLLPASVAAARVPFFEARFDGSQQAWPNDPTGPASFQDGSYRIAPRTPGQFVGIGAPFLQPLRDVAVTASFQKVGGPPGGVYGVILRDAGPSPRDGYNQAGSFYLLGVNDRGQFAVWRREGERWIDLVPLTPSDAVRAGTEMNEIDVHAVDDRISLSVNGVEVAIVLGAQARPGMVGIYVEGDSNDVLVSRFQIETITAAAESTSPPPSAPTSPTAQAPEVAGAMESQPSESRSTTTQARAGFTSAFLREAPATSSRVLASLPNGTEIQVLPETASGEGFTWLQARTSDGLLGWIVAVAVAD